MIITAAVPAPAISSDDTGSAEPDGDSAPDPNSQLARKTGNVTKAHPVSLRVPTKKDGQAIHRLIKQCPPLDLNSVYTYLLLCEHFQQTCVVAEVDHQLYGFVSAYIHPYHADVLFVWQVAVHERARGMGLGKRMLNRLLGRPSTKEVRYVETTVGPDNVPSRRMFHALATDCGAQVQESPLFESELFGPGGHDDECLLRIGPITRKIIQEQTHEN